MSETPLVEFQLFSLANTSAEKLLSPSGTMVLQASGFPRDLADCTYVPVGPVGYWLRTNVIELDAQWYADSEELQLSDIPTDLSSSPKIKDYLCHPVRSGPASYSLSSLSVGGIEVQSITFLGKKLVFRRLNHSVEIDLNDVPDTKRFTISVEWSYAHIEARVTWLEGTELNKHFSGRGVGYDQLEGYSAPQIGTLKQYKERKEFDSTLFPAEIAKAIWQAKRDGILDVDSTGTSISNVGALRKSYVDTDDFYQTLLCVFSEIQNILLKTKPHAFWNHKDPKAEPESGSTLRAFFEAICSYKNIKVYQEDPGRSGNVDFVFCGISNKRNHIELVLEIKNAHSARLSRGLSHQLPQYLTERDSDCGVYGILWFKGRHFDRPTDATVDDCLARLEHARPDSVSSVIAFDVSFPIPASKL